MIMVQALLMAGVAGAQIRMYPLDERTVYTVRVSVGEPTTCVFPGAIKALVGANVSLSAAEAPGVLLSHASGTEYFSLRALKEDAKGALNVLFRGKVYALALVTAAEPDRAVVFLDEPLVGGEKPKLGKEELRALLERAKQHGRLAQIYPDILTSVPRATPGTKSYYKGFTATVEEIVRFEAEDVLVFRVRLENAGKAPVLYDVAGLAVRVGQEIYPAELAAATGSIPAESFAEAFLVVPGNARGGRANLSEKETYNVIVPQ